MKRNKLVNIHLYCACFSSVILLVFALSGSLHLFNIKEGQSVQKVEIVSQDNFYKSEDMSSNVSTYLKNKDSEYSFEYVKGSKESAMTRPTTRDYYTFKLDADGNVNVSKVSPSLRKRLLEFHKGHGRKFSRIINGIFGLCLIVTLISGLWLGLQIKKIRIATIATTLVSLLIFLVEFYS